MEVAKTCPICFEELKEGETASPDICDHIFCLNCLQKWAKREKVCPVDRKRFKKIIDLRTSLPILIKPRKRKKQPELYDVTVHCEVCCKSNNEETLILCDCCDLGFHCKCLTPPLYAVPSGVWYCPMCVAVSEKIRSKKGITKDVELVFKDHINTNSCSSESDSSSSNEFQNISFNSRESKSSENSAKPWKLRKRSNLAMDVSDDDSNEDSKSPYESNFSYNKTPTSNNRNDSDHKSTKSLSSEHLKRLRPRRATPAYTFNNSSSSSEENVCIELKRNYLLRNKNCNYLRNTRTLGESSCSSKESFGIEPKENYYLRNKNQSYSKGVGLTPNSQETKPSKYLDNTFQEKKHEDFNFSVKAKHSIKKKIPEATITSGEENITKELTLSNIVIEHTISLKTANELSKKTIEETETDSTFDVSIVEKNKELSRPCTTADNTCNSRDVPGKLLRSSVGVLSDDKIKELDVSLCKHKKNSRLYGNCDSISRNNKCNVSNLNSNEQNKHEIPIFSVFEKLEDDNSSKKKYFDINHAVNERSSSNCTNVDKSKSTPLVILPKITTVNSISDPISVNTQETKILSEELLKMQKKKWKTYHLQSRKKCNCSLGLQWCHKHSKHRGIDSVQIGHHNKYSEHYNKLLFATRPFIRKPKWDQLDLVILRNIRKKSYIIYNSDNCSSTLNHNPYFHVGNEINNNENKEVISLEAKSILKLKEDEKGLLNAVICMSNINDLAVRPDGTFFVNWKNHNSSNL